jgi:putative FmdB family regulatory protein
VLISFAAPGGPRPLYEYACPKCGEFEVTQRITESSLKKCPTCKSKVRKLMSSTSFQLKGSGWYVTDYAKKGTKDTAKESGSASGEDTTKSADGEAKSGEAKSKDKASETKSEPAKPAKKDAASKAA